MNTKILTIVEPSPEEYDIHVNALLKDGWEIMPETFRTQLNNTNAIYVVSLIMYDYTGEENGV